MTFLTVPEPDDEPGSIWPAALLTLAASGALVSLVALAAIYGG